MQTAIKVEGLTKSYGSLIAADDVSFSVGKGRCFGLLGANGAGKSTIVECILGTKKADAGSVSVLGCDPRTERKKLFRKIGVQFQECNFPPEIKVGELCEETACLYRKPADAKELCVRFGLKDKMKSAVKTLSGGERQRLFIVLALIPDPEIVFFDELSTGIDARARREIRTILSGLKEKGLTVFLTSHFMDEVEALCDEICILRKGRVVFRGSVDRAKEASGRNSLEEAYLLLSEQEVERI